MGGTLPQRFPTTEHLERFTLTETANQRPSDHTQMLIRFAHLHNEHAGGWKPGYKDKYPDT